MILWLRQLQISLHIQKNNANRIEIPTMHWSSSQPNLQFFTPLQTRLELIQVASSQSYSPQKNDKYNYSSVPNSSDGLIFKNTGERRALLQQKYGRQTGETQVFVILSPFCDLVHVHSVVDLFAKQLYNQGWAILSKTIIDNR